MLSMEPSSSRCTTKAWILHMFAVWQMCKLFSVYKCMNVIIWIKFQGLSETSNENGSFQFPRKPIENTSKSSDFNISGKFIDVIKDRFDFIRCCSSWIKQTVNIQHTHSAWSLIYHLYLFSPLYTSTSGFVLLSHWIVTFIVVVAACCLLKIFKTRSKFHLKHVGIHAN